MQELVDYLSSITAGKVNSTNGLDNLIAQVWDGFKGSSAQGTTGFKLHGRMEDILWDPPLLKFTIERHGGTVKGSSRADLHQWTLDLNLKTATCKTSRFRQLEATSPKLDVKPIARDIANSILKSIQDERLKWHSPTKVAYLTGKIIPESCAHATTVSRRKRFKKELEMILNPEGWTIKAGSNICEKLK